MTSEQEPKKPREFWLNIRLERIYKDSDASCPDDEVHVVEFQALKNVRDAYEARETELLNLVRDLTNALKSCAEYIYLESKDSQSPYFNHGGNCMRLVAVEEKSAEALVKADATLKRLGVTE